MIYTVKVALGKEDSTVKELQNKMKKDNFFCIYSFSVLPDINGYIFLEANKEENLQLFLKGVKSIRGGIIAGSVNPNEILRHIDRTPLWEDYYPKREIEIIEGIMKGSKGKIIRTNKKRNEVIVLLNDSSIRIPVTLDISHIKIR